jgi:hypothetical protein
MPVCKINLTSFIERKLQGMGESSSLPQVVSNLPLALKHFIDNSIRIKRSTEPLRERRFKKRVKESKPMSHRANRID